MLLNFKELVKEYNLKITGVCQVGAHEGQEIEMFKELGIKQGKFFEPCKEAFYKLLKHKIPGYQFYQTALGSESGLYLMINKTKVNEGQSNSLLKPKIHLDYYPDITFDETEEVGVNKLDWFTFPVCNLLVMDVQGYELEVLKGATETLKGIDYIYTEVNREELYEGCVMVDELDNFLSDFKRVETKWTNRGWGDAMYIKSNLL